MTDIVLTIFSTTLIDVTNGDGVLVGSASPGDNITVTNAGRIYAGDDGIEIGTYAPTVTGTIIVENSGTIISTYVNNSYGQTDTGRAINVDLPLTPPAM